MGYFNSTMFAILLIAIIIGVFTQRQLTNNDTKTTLSGDKKHQQQQERHEDSDFSSSLHIQKMVIGDEEETLVVSTNKEMMNSNTTTVEDSLWDTSTDKIDPSLMQGSDECTIERVREEDMTPTRFATEYWRKKPVILLRKEGMNAVAQEMTKKQTLLDNFGDKKIPLAKLESYAFRDEQHGTLRDYILDIQNQATPTNNSTRFAFSSDQFEVGHVYVVPDIMSEIPNLLDPSFQVAIAGSGTGLAFHWHADVWAETLHGARRWLLFPPHTSPPFNPRMTSAEWVRDIRPIIVNAEQSNEHQQHDDNHQKLKHMSSLVKEAFQECTLKQNEAIYVPANWFHATLSLGEAVSITTSYASTFRRDRYQIDHGTSDNSHMLDSFSSQDFVKAMKYADQLRRHRPNSFVPYSWMGVILTMDAKTRHTGSLNDFQKALNLALSVTLKCVELNPYFCPCHVWASRQLKALSSIHHHGHLDMNSMSADDEKIIKQEQWQMLQRAQMHIEMAQQLSSIDDDEMLDPRWQPKYMSAARQ